MPPESRKIYFHISLIINVVFILGALFLLMKYQVLFGSKPNLMLTSPHSATFNKFAEPTQSPNQQPASQLRPFLAGKVTDIKGTSISLDAYSADGSKKAVVFSVNESTKYFKIILASSGQPQAAGEPPKPIVIQKIDIKVGDFISALFESPVDLNNNNILVPKTINLLPPPQILPNK